MVKRIVLFTLLLFLALQSGCGYHFIGENSEVLSGINAIAIPYFENKTYQSGLERQVTEALVDEFVKSRAIAIVSEGDADAVIRGVVEEFREFVSAFDENDYALEYGSFLSLSVTLERKDTGEVLWRNKSLTHFEDYNVSSAIALTEENKEQAILLSSRELAIRIHDSIIEGF
jgi:outer membrane lipopolysaccharide assembly protein LptE/RlpB